jgi:murein DD-endopeptidase MepM/ murein hydrolase activator NlpD
MRKVRSRIGGVLVVIALLAVATFAQIASVIKDTAVCATSVAVGGTTKLLESFDKSQLGFLSLANNIGLQLKLSEKDRATALAAMIQESRAKNLDYGDRDSVGLFQQRPSVKAWGTTEQIKDPNHAIRAFYKALVKINGRASMAPLDIALKVQRPSRSAYLSPSNFFPGWVDDAYAFIRRDSADKPAPEVAGVNTSAQIKAATNCSLDGVVLAGVSKRLLSGKGKLRYPTSDTSVGSPFGMRFHPIDKVWRLHNGADFPVACNTPIYASAAGVVKRAGWDGGLGNYVQIDHGGGIQTGYAHQSRFAPGIQPGVSVSQGQLIGYVGTTGKSTGCHLHFITLKNGRYVDPESFL